MKFNFLLLFFRRVFIVLSGVLLTAVFAAAQTGAFTYQGRLTDASNTSKGVYLFEFKLYDAAENGTLIDTLSNIQAIVTNGVFTVELNFTAANAFDGGERYLEIGVKRASDPPETVYTTLTPRQRITSAPYAMRARNGQNGLNALLKTTAEAAGANCTAGGTKIETGLDANRNGTLDAEEINPSQTRYVCNGAPAAAPVFYTRSLPTRSTTPNGALTIEFSCLNGDRIISGGYSTHKDNTVQESLPSAVDKWRFTVFNPTAAQNGVSFHIVCADLTP